MIIGITGTIGAGKGTVAKYLNKKGFEYHSYSEILKEEAKKRGYPATRLGLQKMGNIIRAEHNDEGYLSSKIIEKIKTDKVVVDGIRNPHEIERLRKEKDFFLIGIDAPQKTRFERLFKRKRSGDPKTFENFKKIDDMENQGKSYGQDINKCLKMADHVIKNDGSLKRLKDEFERILYLLRTE